MLNENTDMFSDILDEFDDDDSDISFNLIYSIIERLHALQESHNISCACGSEDIEIKYHKRQHYSDMSAMQKIKSHRDNRRNF